MALHLCETHGKPQRLNHLSRTGNFEHLYLVTDFDVVIVSDANTAFVTILDFLNVVLEASQRRDLAFVDHHIVAQQANASAARDRSVGDVAAGDDPDLGDLEGLANLDQLTSPTVEFIALPMKIVDGDGSPVRAIAIER